MNARGLRIKVQDTSFSRIENLEGEKGFPVERYALVSAGASEISCLVKTFAVRGGITLFEKVEHSLYLTNTSDPNGRRILLKKWLLD
jgi:hypothetical protein